MTTKRQTGICGSQLTVKQNEKSREGRVWDKRKGFLFSVCDLNRCDKCVASVYVCEDLPDLPPRRPTCTSTHTHIQTLTELPVLLRHVGPFCFCLLIASFLISAKQNTGLGLALFRVVLSQIKRGSTQLCGLAHECMLVHIHPH